MRQRVVLIFCQDIDGHRQTYVAVMGAWFRSRGWKVVVALANAEDGCPSGETQVLGQFLSNEDVRVFSLGDAGQDHGAAGFWIKTLRKIEDEVKPDWTVFVVGDQCRRILQGLGYAGRPQGTHRAGVFIYVNHEYRPDLRGLTLSHRLRLCLRWWRNRWRERSYFQRSVWRELGLDRILTTNEDFWRCADDERISFMPEIYRAWGFEMPANDPMIARFRESYQSFLAQQGGRDIILYYGTRFARRGYDTLLALARDYTDTAFVSCGRDAPEQAFEYDVASLRNQLNSEARLFEVDLPFLPEHPLTDDLFQSARYILLPYRQWSGLSGSLFQAASYGKPVLVPDIGHMASMVRQHGIGLAFTCGDSSDFQHKFHLLRGDSERYIPAALEFAQRHDQDNLYNNLDAAFAL